MGVKKKLFLFTKKKKLKKIFLENKAIRRERMIIYSQIEPTL